jgi:diguanylate cyclase (GGDEF)-like protein
MIVRESTPGYVRQRGDWPVLISVRYLDGSFLSELSSRHLIEAPRFSRTGERRMGEQAAPLLDDSGRPVGHLVWKPELPGSGILGTLAPLTGGLALFMCLITGALARRLIRTTTELAEAEARSSHLAFHDALTGLPNRALLADRLERALTNATDDARAALLLVDLDRFKQVNDTLGHQAGDALIVLFADRLAALAGERDTVARLGGDEFAIVALGREARGVEDLCARILRAAAASFDLAGGTVHVGASIGVATAGRCDATELTRRADVALYAAKEDGRGVARIFSAELDTAVRERAALEEELRRALAAGELHVWFQPQVCRKGRVVGLEALARWQHPTRGLIGPDRFIKAAEDTGLIVEIGELVMREAAAMSARWPNLSVAVNVSPAQLRSNACVERLIGIVRHAGIDPIRMEIEVTEHILLESESAGAGRIQQLRAAGFRLALDDFGTGYSSLSYLQRFQVDKIKIDQSFVSQLAASPDSLAIVTAILSLGRALGVQVAAEGVEVTGQFDLLLAGGCEEFQGYLFCQPQPRLEIEAFLTGGDVAQASRWSRYHR